MSEESTIAERQSIAANMALGVEHDGHSEHDKKLLKKAKVALYVHKDAESALLAAQGDAVDVFMHLGQLGETMGLPHAVKDRSGNIVRNPDGSLRVERRPGRSQERYKRYTEALHNARRFIELREGYDKVPGVQQEKIRGELKELLKRDRGAIGKKFRHLPSETARDDAVIKVLQDPDIARYVRDELVMLQGKNLSMRQRKEYLEQVAARAQLVDTHEESDKLVSEAGGNTQSASQLLASIRGVDGADPTLLTVAQKGPQVVAIEKQIEKLQENLSVLQGQVPESVSSGRLVSSGATSMGNEAVSANIAQQQLIRNQINELSRNLIALLPSVAGAEDSNLTRRQQEIALIRQRAAETANELSANAEIGDMEREREEEEEEITSALEGVFARAAYRKILTDFQTSLRVVGEQQPVVEGKFMEAIDKGIVNHLENKRWRKKVLKKRKGIFGFLRKKQEDLVIDTERVRQDSDLLFKRGPEVLLRRVLRGVRVPQDGGFPRSLTTEQIDDLMDEKEFVEKWGGVVAGQVMGRKQLFDGYRPTEVHHFMDTEWGKEAMHKAYATDESYRAFINMFADNGVVNFDSPTFRNKLAEWAAQFPGSLIFPRTSFRWAADGGHVDQIVDRPRPELVPTAA